MTFYYAPEWGNICQTIIIIFTPEDDDEDYGFIDFEDDNYDGNDDEYYDSDDEYADSYNDSDDDYSINRNYNKYDSKASNQKNNSQGLVSFILSEAFSFFKICSLCCYICSYIYPIS